MTDREIELLSKWAETSAAEGDLADLPPAQKFSTGWQLGLPDLVVKMPEPFTIPADGRDLYRAFVLPLNVPEDRYVAGVR